MPKINASVIAKKMVENAKRSTEAYREGVLNPIRGAATAALAAADKRAEAVRRSLDNKTWEKAMATISDDYVKRKAADVGSGRYASGVEAAKDKIENFWNKWTPHLEEIRSKIQTMPDISDTDREARMIENLKAMRAKKGVWR